MAKPLTMMAPNGQRVEVPDGPDIIFREDGRVEWLCPHGVGHPIGHRRMWRKWMAIHGCDGCCFDHPFLMAHRPQAD